MAYAHTNSKGQTYYLHSAPAKNSGTKLYHFAKAEKSAGQEPTIPSGYTVSENPKTHLPILKKS